RQRPGRFAGGDALRCQELPGPGGSPLPRPRPGPQPLRPVRPPARGAWRPAAGHAPLPRPGADHIPAKVEHMTGSYALFQNGRRIAGGTAVKAATFNGGLRLHAKLRPGPSQIKFALTASRAGRSYLLSADSTAAANAAIDGNSQSGVTGAGGSGV